MIMHFFLFPLCSLGRIVVASEFIFSKKICIFILLKIEMVYLPLLDQTSEVHNICYSEGKKWHTNPKLDILTGSVFLSTKNASLIFPPLQAANLPKIFIPKACFDVFEIMEYVTTK